MPIVLRARLHRHSHAQSHPREEDRGVTTKSIGDDRIVVTTPEGKEILVKDEKKFRARKAVNRRFGNTTAIRVARKGQIS